MKIVICNKFFFISGGTDRYMFELMDELEVLGHTTIPFSVKHGISKPSKYDKHFLPPPALPDQIFYNQIRLRDSNILRLIDRSIYSLEARKYLNRLIVEEGPIDIGYILNIYNYMSPSIIHVFKKHKIPVVYMVGDYNLQCPAYTFMRDGRPCTLCIGNRYFHALRYKCVKKSFVATLVRVMAMYLYSLLNIYQMVDAFVVPCNFMKEIMVKGGYPENKIRVIKYPVRNIDLSDVEGDVGIAKKSYILYFGRISYEKGLDILIKAYETIANKYDVNLVLLGRDYDGEKIRLEKIIKPHLKGRIFFPGFIEGKDLSRWIVNSLFTVVPSRWYDNAPLSIYESYLHGIPVVGAKIGGIAEQIEDKVTGRLFEPESSPDLASKIEWMLADKDRLKKMGSFAREKVLKENNYGNHVRLLLDLFNELLSKKSNL